MTQWGVLLLCVYVTLGLGRATWRKAGRLAFILTTIVICVVMVSYTSRTPKAVTSAINATGGAKPLAPTYTSGAGAASSAGSSGTGVAP